MYKYIPPKVFIIKIQLMILQIISNENVHLIKVLLYKTFQEQPTSVPISHYPLLYKDERGLLLS